MSVLLALMASGISRLIDGRGLSRDGTLVIVFWFLVLRLCVSAGAAVTRRIRRRFRWQLIGSHIGLVVLMFIVVTSGSSIVGLVVATHSIATHPVDMAASVRENLQLANALSTLDRKKTERVFELIYARRLVLRGNSPLVAFVSAPVLPNGVGLVTRGGNLVSGRVLIGSDGKKTRPASSLADVMGLPVVSVTRLLRQVISGHVARQSVPGNSVPQTTIMMPVRGPDGRIASAIVLRVADYQPTQAQFLRLLLAVFGLTTITLIVTTSLPLLGLSFLFSYVVARGLTGRLESLSRVATSIASGNFTMRAPVTTRNEVGQLAEDVNRMADHLETTMGELQQARKASEEALRVTQDLMANISHELRTPLATIRAHLETVTLRSPVPAGGSTVASGSGVSVSSATIDALHSEAQRLEALVEDLFALSRAQAKAMEIHLEPVDVATLAHEITGLMRPLALREGRIALTADVLHGPLWAMADASRLQQILANLIRNAVRHTPDGGIIVLSVRRQDESILVAVADTGEGIPAEHLPFIFDRFYRADAARSRSTGGAGLGLAIVREFVEAMDGQVVVASEVGAGTTFTVTLPSAAQPGSDSVRSRRLV